MDQRIIVRSGSEASQKKGCLESEMGLPALVGQKLSDGWFSRQGSMLLAHVRNVGGPALD